MEIIRQYKFSVGFKCPFWRLLFRDVAQENSHREVNFHWQQLCRWFLI